MRAGGAERVGEARAAAAVDRNAARAAAVVVEHIRERGQLEHPRADEVTGARLRVGLVDRVQADRRRRARGADDGAEPPHERTVSKDLHLTARERDVDPPGDMAHDHAVSPDPPGRSVRPPGKPDAQPRLTVGSRAHPEDEQLLRRAAPPRARREQAQDRTRARLRPHHRKRDDARDIGARVPARPVGACATCARRGERGDEEQSGRPPHGHPVTPPGRTAARPGSTVTAVWLLTGRLPPCRVAMAKALIVPGFAVRSMRRTTTKRRDA